MAASLGLAGIGAGDEHVLHARAFCVRQQLVEPVIGLRCRAREAESNLVAVRRQPAPAGSAAEYQHADASLLLVDYEVIAAPGLEVRRLDQCKGRLVDRSGRTWEANAPAKLSGWLARRGIGSACGSRVVGSPAEAVPGVPFGFTHAFLVPADTPMDGLHVDVFFPPSTTRPRMGTYLRFAVPAPRQ